MSVEGKDDNCLSSTPKGKNAFSFMMKAKGSSEKINNRKRTSNQQSTSVKVHAKASASSQPSRFVPCPYCSKAISSAFIQVHVDKCSSNAEYQRQEHQKQERKKAKIFQNHRESVSAGLKSDVNPDKNAFKKMMDHSKQWNFGDTNKSSSQDPSRKAKRQQWFHLTKDLKVIWIPDESGEGKDPSDLQSKVDRLCGEIQWSSSILIHASKINETNQDNIELNVTSSIPPSARTFPFVQNHSRLSIPVLKSILQKSVRRRRPLPSVKVAMELADKALGELLRRLPIICIEDSTLHHDFPFLVWLMVAQSKQFQPTRPMMTRVFRAVFEIASCPWRDNLGMPKSSEDVPDASMDISLTAMKNVCNEETGNDNTMKIDTSCDLMIRSILLRHKYGGMGCDLRMLQQYARVWQYRLLEEHVMSQPLAQSCLPKHCDSGEHGGAPVPIQWSHVPKLLHPVERSSKAVMPLLTRSIPYLKYADVTPAGVDFHCSNILDIPLYNLNMQSQIQELYNSGNTDSAKKLSLQELGGVLKRACWDHCSGVNYRRTFRQAVEQTTFASASSVMKDEETERIKQIWDFISPSVQTFTKNYLTERMVAPR